MTHILKQEGFSKDEKSKEGTGFLTRSESSNKIKKINEKSESLVGSCQGMTNLNDMINKLAASDNATVLIQGESGTGKQLVAKAIHHRSNRANEPFITIDFNLLPESLIEGELFGYAKGAFTGAMNNRIGLIESANGGTLFFDEIEDLKLALQGKLLHLLEEREFRRLGEVKNRNMNVRVIASTKNDLKSFIKKGNFRLDLYHRISMISLNLPPLREREEDIVLLARFFISKFNKKYNKNVAGLSEEAANLLQLYSWPGNVR